MVKRIISAWPYALAVVAVMACWWALQFAVHLCSARAGCGLSDMDWLGMSTTFVLVVFPIATLAIGAVLGLRRGYDWVTVLVCLAVWAVIPDPVVTPDMIAAGYEYKQLSVLACILIAGHLGIAAGILLKRLLRKQPVAAATAVP